MQATLLQKAHISKAIVFFGMGQAASSVKAIEGSTKDPNAVAIMQKTVESVEYTFAIARSFLYHGDITMFARDLAAHDNPIAREGIIKTILSPEFGNREAGITIEMITAPA